MEKILAMNVAAQLTAAACTGIGRDAPISADLTDPATRSKNLQVWETFRSYYHAVAGALASEGWPSPAIGSGSLVQALGETLGKAIVGPDVAKLLGDLVAAIPRPSIPSPGAPPATPSAGS